MGLPQRFVQWCNPFVIGYDLRWRVLNAIEYGVPQKWERVIVVASLGNLDRFEWPNTVPMPPLESVLEASLDVKHYRCPNGSVALVMRRTRPRYNHQSGMRTNLAISVVIPIPAPCGTVPSTITCWSMVNAA